MGTAGAVQRGSILALSVFAAQIHLVPLFGFAIFPRPGEVCQRERLWQYGKVLGFAKGYPFGRAVTTGD